MLLGSDVEKQPLGIFQIFLHAHEKRNRFAAVDKAMIVGKRQIHHRPDLDLAVDRNGPLLYLVHAQYARLRWVADWRGHDRTEDTDIGNREVSALPLLQPQ